MYSTKVSNIYFITLFVAFFCFFTPSYGQQDVSFTPSANQKDGKKKKRIKKTVDSNYVHQYPQFLSIGVFTALPSMEIKINPTVQEDLSKGNPAAIKRGSSDYKGSFANMLGINFAYRSVNIVYGFKTAGNPKTEDKQGQTSYNILGIKIKKAPFIISIDYSRYKGFYDRNADQYDANRDPNRPFIIRPDLSIESFTAGAICNLNWRKYSYFAPFNYTERQIKSKVGFLMKGKLSYTTIDADSSMVNALQDGYFYDFGKVHTVNAWIFKTGPGIGWNLVIGKRVYFSVAAYFCGNLTHYKYIKDDGNSTPWRNSVNFFTEGNAALGYNSKRFYMGLKVNGDINVMSLTDAKVQTTFGNVAIDIGYRFNCPGFFRKAWEKTLTRYLKL